MAFLRMLVRHLMSSRKKAKQLQTDSRRENKIGERERERGKGRERESGEREKERERDSARKLAFCDSNIEENAETQGVTIGNPG